MRLTPVRVLVIVVLLGTAFPTAGLDLVGEKRIVLSSADGSARLDIGAVTFAPDGDGFRFEVRLDEQRFGNHFLSMRPFKCLEGETQYLCHLPYPYKKGNRVAADDFVDLEHELLFVHKQPTEYGINMWNGVYYKLRQSDAGLRGRLHEVDMDILASPPQDPTRYPLAEAEKYAAEPESHLLPTVIIE